MSSSIFETVKTILKETRNEFSKILQVQHNDIDLTGAAEDIMEGCLLSTIGEGYEDFLIDNDLIIFPMFDTLPSGVLAAAAPCLLHPETNRPVGGIVYINNNLDLGKTNTNFYMKNILLHEITHILVFHPTFFNYFNMITTYNGVSYINSPKVLEKAKEHFGCSTIQRIALENDGGEGSAGSHWESRYMLGDVPTMAYRIGGFTVDKTGGLSWDDTVDNGTILKVYDEIRAAGFEPEEEPDLRNTPEAAPAEDTGAESAEEDGLEISLPLDGFNPDSLDRLQKLVDSKARLTQKALGADRLTIQVKGDKVCFPWWDTMPSPEEMQAYMAFIAALCAMAKQAKRVTSYEKEVESEKFSFRVWLLRMGFKGNESKAQRAILLKRLSGSAAFPNKAAADAFSAEQKAKRDAAKAAAAAQEENA